MTAATASTTLTLQIAKQLIIKRQYREAAAVLTTIRGDATADQWLAKLEARLATRAALKPNPNEAYLTDPDFPTAEDMAPLRDVPTTGAGHRKPTMLHSLAAMLS